MINISVIGKTQERGENLPKQPVLQQTALRHNRANWRRRTIVLAGIDKKFWLMVWLWQSR